MITGHEKEIGQGKRTAMVKFMGLAMPPLNINIKLMGLAMPPLNINIKLMGLAMPPLNINIGLSKVELVLNYGSQFFEFIVYC